jgi:hypothetical protein
MFGDQNDDSATFQDYVELILNSETNLNDESNMMIIMLIMRLKHHVITKKFGKGQGMSYHCRLVIDTCCPNTYKNIGNDFFILKKKVRHF